MAFFVSLVLGKDAPQVYRAGFGAPIQLLTFSSFQFLLAHRQSRGIGTHIEDWHWLGFRQRLGGPARLPLLGRRPNVLYRSLDLSRRYVDAASFPQMLLCFLIARFIGSFQADQAQQGWCFASFNAQCGVCWIMPEAFAGVMVVIPLQDKGAEDAIDRYGLPALALLSGFGLVGSIDLVGCALQEKAHQLGGRFEHSSPDQHFEPLHIDTAGCGGLEAGYELVDFLFLGQEELGREGFFLEPAAIATRV